MGGILVMTPGGLVEAATIPGPEGPEGPPGADGADGAPGADGADSTVPGPEGPEGPQGPAGADGADGAPGADGADGVGVPAGGTTGQALVKNSNTDFDTEWSDVAAGGGTETLLLENGASVPGGTASGTIVYEKAITPVTYDFTLGSLPAGWAERGTNSESFSGSGMAITSLAANNGYYIDPSSPPTQFAVDLYILTQSSVTSIMFGPQIATSGGAGAQANWYNSPNAVMVGTLSAWAYGGNFQQTGTGPPSYPTVLRLRRDATNYYASYSADGGVTWSSESAAQVGTAGTRIGFGSSFGTPTVTVQKVIYRPGFTGRTGAAKGWWDGSALQPFA
jgi:hypothetical protein